jgi:hypothetical protein
MKKILSFLLISLLVAGTAYAEYVRGHTKRDGTYVSGYNRSSSNNTVRDNYSYAGNTNPYTGQTGSNYYRNSPSSDYYGTSSRRRNRYSF